MMRIDTAFDPITQDIHTFFQQPGIGYYIPLYQREYTWDEDNIEQLLSDLSRGIENCLSDDDEIRFLGTIILVQEINPKDNIEPQDARALPSRIDKVIDGQQRLSTIALLATKLYERIEFLESKIPKGNPLRDDILQASRDWKEKLIDLFSMDLRRGKPERKPKIIRGSIDQWTLDGDVQNNYQSPVANYLAKFISQIFLDTEKPKVDKNNKVGKNLKQIESWLKNVVELSHLNDSSDFSTAQEIIEKLNQSHIWQYDRPDLVTEVLKKETQNKKDISYVLSSFVQIFSVCHYLLDRCCFTVIKPIKEDRAFDLFQSLNATGTPLTAIETFSPLVVNTTLQNEDSYISSKTKINFENIESLFLSTNTAAQKNKLTNDFLTSLAITSEGKQLSSHFSNQRKWLNNIFSDLSDYEEKKSLINLFGNYALYYKEIWNEYIGENNLPIKNISSHTDSNIISMLILFLKSSNHKMSISILGRYYHDILNGKDKSINEFTEATKIITSYYILWRSVKSNSGLDKTYRDFFKDAGLKWICKKNIPIDKLKNYFKNELKKIGVNDKKSWVDKSKNYLRYDNSKKICKILLHIAFNQTIPDKSNPGLMKLGEKGTSAYLTLDKWNSKDLRTIEHIAPQSNNGEWNNDLYSPDSKLFDSIGNLTLLPLNINSSVGNKGWQEKLLYYKHISEKDPSKKQELSNKAKGEGIKLKEETIIILQKVNYSSHIEPLLNFDENLEWDKDFVNKRTDRILDLAWDELSKWIDLN